MFTSRSARQAPGNTPDNRGAARRSNAVRSDSARASSARAQSSRECSARTNRQGKAPPRRRSGASDTPERPVIVEFDSASGGCGLSVTAACYARTLASVGLRCALVDLDFDGGGLDVTLGLEGEHGLRWSGVDAPLGRIDGDALVRELIDWNGIAVLPADPWNKEAPSWWHITAALGALCEVCDVVVVDSGRMSLPGRLEAAGFGVSSPWRRLHGDEGAADYAALANCAELPNLAARSDGPPPPPGWIGGGEGLGTEGVAPTMRGDAWLSDPRFSDTQLSGTRSFASSREAEASLGTPGGGQGFRPDDAADAPIVCAVHMLELSVLGAVRARRHIDGARRVRRLCARGARDALSCALTMPPQEIVLCSAPASQTSARGAVTVADLRDYLSDDDIVGPLPRDKRLAARVLSGEGVEAVPRAMERVLGNLTERWNWEEPWQEE